MNAPLSTLRLYEISATYREALEDLSEANDLPPEAIADTLEALAGTFEAKALAVAAYIKNLETEADAVESARKRMEQRQRALRNSADNLRAYLQQQMECTDIRKAKNAEIALRIQKNPAAVRIDDESLIPDAYRETVTITRLRKADIAQALKAGENVPGTHLEQTFRLVIS